MHLKNAESNHNRIECNLIVNRLESNHSEFAKIVLESNRKPMNRESIRFAVYPKIYSHNFYSIKYKNMYSRVLEKRVPCSKQRQN